MEAQGLGERCGLQLDVGNAWTRQAFRSPGFDVEAGELIGANEKIMIVAQNFCRRRNGRRHSGPRVATNVIVCTGHDVFRGQMGDILRPNHWGGAHGNDVEFGGTGHEWSPDD